jgi:uncharacterized protein YecE (DUF72 family)
MLPPPSLRIGPSGWEYPEWKGIVYPARESRRLHPLEYLSRHFDVVEVVSTFHQTLRPELVRFWLAKVAHNPAFQFTAVLGRQFTYERCLEPAEVARFKEGLWPLERAHRLGCLLMQFPWAFRFTAENREFLIQLRRAFHEFPMAVEMRHRSWMAEEALGTLIDYRLGFVNIDQPDYASAMPPSALVTSGVAYVRMHGHDRNYWQREFTSAAGLDDYLYSPGELTQWKERINHVRAHAHATFVITSNSAAGKSVVNALQLQSLLGVEPDSQTPRHANAA